MATEEELQAIATLQDLGIPRKQAVKALARYGYDVGRAADYIFSGNAVDSDNESDNDNDVNTNKSENEKGVSEGPLISSTNSNTRTGWDGVDDNNHLNDDSCYVSEHFPDDRKHLIKDFDRKTATSATVSYDPAMWSVVPSKPTLTSDATPSLTWWVDPDDPSDRLAASDVPIGLRPPQFNFPYAPAILQSLFHIKLFQHRVLSYRPTAEIWGSSRCYWEGNSEPVPSLSRPVHQRRRRTDRHGSDENSDESNDSNNINITNPNLFNSLPNCVRTVAELQKLFAFLGHSQRQYMNVSQFVHSLDTKCSASSNWDAQDFSVDEFIDIIISTLTEADQQREIQPEVEDFQSLFSLCARVEYGREVDHEEIFCLTLNFTEQTLSFHECLGPLVYESGAYEQEDNASDNLSFSSDEVSLVGGRVFKLTTFERVPPILLVTLEDKTLKTKTAGSNKNITYHVDKTLYMDRYLLQNREKILASYQQEQVWRDEIKQANELMAKLRNYNLTVEPGKTTAGAPTTIIDKREILSKTINYFSERSNKESIQDLQNVLKKTQDRITVHLEELEDLVKQRSNDLQNLFDKPEYQQMPYDVRAILYHDGMNGTGHYWAYIWVEPDEENLLQDIPNDAGGWFRFCDANVRPSNEDEVFNEPLNPFAVIYVDRTITSYSKVNLSDVTAESLQAYVDQDNKDFQQEIEAFNRGECIIEERIDSPGLTASQDDDSVSTGDVGSTGTAVGGGHTAVISPEHQKDEQQSPLTRTPAENVSLERSISESQQSRLSGGSLGELKEPQPIEIEEGVTAMYNHSLQERLSKYINNLLFTTQQCHGDDYRLLKNFECFLAKLGNDTLLEYFIYKYTEDQEHDVPILREEESRDDIQLSSLWLEFDRFSSIASTVTIALVGFGEDRYMEAMLHFIHAQQEEAEWKTHLLMDTDILQRFPSIEELGFTSVIKRFGKQCIKILNERAHTKADDPAYRTRGLEEAIQIARYAQTIIGPEKLASDRLFGEMREEWLKYSEIQGANLEGPQVGLLNELIMAYLEAESVVSNDPSLTYLGMDPALIKGDGTTNESPLWERYQRALQYATIRANHNF
ncbi:hypothetical protein BDA99DRAFT_498260 [Phascolomyces articulosus]|uniref:Ubiquitinyl hydrolase 1 n=1 Tax=Phascolomyces articulosus TaxID=60185 RepID=A0AAD5K980_9FUNG|nr:hypothetical protein BDA99DRAFT_498260 [Phascolomyces articulosus]